ncbi:MAG: hypothetical protein IT385_22040 [Deltaproteobacteria bacterium]|nr:hypothetical protein [Deltaproteobacteria bacterium]
MTVIIPANRSWGTALIAALGGAATIALGTALVLDPTVPASATPWLIGLVALFGWACGLVALKLAHARGGLVLDPATRRLGLGVTATKDTWWLPLAELAGVRVALEARTERWLALIERRGAPPIAVAAAEERAGIVKLVDYLAEATTLPVMAEDPGPRPRLGVGRVRFGVRRGAALQGLLGVFGLALVAVSVVTFFQEDRFAALLIGPLLAIIGLVLFAVALVKRFAHEELVSDGATLTHSFVFGRFRWADKTITTTRPIWRLWIEGMRGAHLEVVGEDRTLIVGAGANTRSAMDLDALAALPTRFPPASEGES